ncbi:hypothetical protein [Robertkochia aurantiaca]|uniref:hypothetical protein n=1 Tax=Robertkochia aurantiaca TaxID=2873700 RepID=UPI001CC9F74F|nr:hypothetical protein [Robertkochia sp. 3YJGBD-33]
MNNQEEKKLDSFIRKAVKDTGLETPSPALKMNIMAAIQRQAASIKYRALIPKWAWLTTALILLFLGVLAIANPMGLTGLPVDLFPWELSWSWGEFSPLAVYGTAVFVVMAVIQIVFLKRKIDQRFYNN